jgi:hypothetical protein
MQIHSTWTQISKVGSSCENLGKLLLGYCVALIASIGFTDHQFELIVGHCLAQFHRDVLQVLECDQLLVVTGEQLVSPLNFFLRLLFVHLGSHNLQELCVVDGVGVLLVLLFGVDVWNQLFNFILFGFKAEGSEGHL